MLIRLAYLTVVMIWATTPLAIQWSSQGVSPFLGGLGRMSIAFVICLVLARLRDITIPLHKAALKVYAAAVMGQSFALMFVYWGSSYISSGLVSLIFGLTPILTGLMAYQFFNERLSFIQCAGIVGALLGLVLVFSDDLMIGGSDEAYKGVLAVMTATFLFGVSNLLVKRFGEGVEIDPMALTLAILACSIPSYSICLMFTGFQFDFEVLSLKTGGSILYLGVFGSVLAPFCYFMVLKKMSATAVSLITVMTPVIAIFLGAQLNDELVGAKAYMGAAFILLSLMLYNVDFGGVFLRVSKGYSREQS